MPPHQRTQPHDDEAAELLRRHMIHLDRSIASHPFRRTIMSHPFCRSGSSGAATASPPQQAAAAPTLASSGGHIAFQQQLQARKPGLSPWAAAATAADTSAATAAAGPAASGATLATASEGPGVAGPVPPLLKEQYIMDLLQQQQQRQLPNSSTLQNYQGASSMVVLPGGGTSPCWIIEASDPAAAGCYRIVNNSNTSTGLADGAGAGGGGGDGTTTDSHESSVRLQGMVQRQIHLMASNGGWGPSPFAAASAAAAADPTAPPTCQADRVPLGHARSQSGGTLSESEWLLKLPRGQTTASRVPSADLLKLPRAKESAVAKGAGAQRKRSRQLQEASGEAFETEAEISAHDSATMAAATATEPAETLDGWREKNRTAQQRFRQRQKVTICGLKEEAVELRNQIRASNLSQQMLERENFGLCAKLDAMQDARLSLAGYPQQWHCKSQQMQQQQQQQQQQLQFLTQVQDLPYPGAPPQPGARPQLAPSSAHRQGAAYHQQPVILPMMPGPAADYYAQQ